MFPVKGLSISAEKLKVETEAPAASTPSAPKPSRKRKRQGNTENVTAANFADLWEKVIEHKGPSGPATSAQQKPQPKKDNKRQKKDHESPAGKNMGSKEQQEKPSDRSEKKQKKKDKKQKRDSLAAAAEKNEEEGDEWNGIDDEEKAPDAAQQVEEKGDKKKKKQKDDTQPQQSADKTPKAEAAAPPPAPPPASSAPKLTPLQASMREKLISARFRHLNETLYTRPSAEAFQLFQDSPEMFTEYHEGFRRQVEVWPENPVDGYIADIKARAKVRFAPRNRTTLSPSDLPLPKPPNTKTCTIADLGCGDAKLATTLQPLTKKLHLTIHSFDLQTGGSPLVTRADIANLPLQNDSVDVAIFCLALMGTNWLAFVEEAYRILRWRGELWVAEIKSRFTNPAANKKKTAVVPHSVGNRKKLPPPTSKKSKAAAAEEEEEANLAALAEHVDGVDPSSLAKQQQGETDISAFVEALRKRGFLLNRDLGENAVDMSNKMFVRMHFVKAAPALKGKCAAPGAAEQKERKWTDGKGRVVQQAKKKKFIDEEGEEVAEGNEAAVLKPCVYKIR
jgi:ribosomal RNA-processing protein 8